MGAVQRRCVDLEAYDPPGAYYISSSQVLNDYRHIQSFNTIQESSDAIMSKLKTHMLLAIQEPGIRMTLLDSLGKRITFLQEVCNELGLQNVQCVHARAEEFAAEHRQSFDFAVSRAVANLSVLCELCLPLVKAGGYFLSMKSVESDEELEAAKKAIKILGGQVERTADYQIPGTEVVHRVIFIKKIAETPKKYPRPFAKIKKNPL